MKSKFISAGLFAVVAICTGGWAADMVPFAPPWDDASPGPTNISGTIEKPAGKSGFVNVKESHLYAGEHRLRLFGVNLTAGADFPDHATADKVAGRMAKFGLNAVRFHFLDSTWGTPKLIKYETGDWKNWNAESLDRLDYFIGKLKENGIYSNLNLLVGRRFGVGDGVDPKINQLEWKVAHAVGFFHAPHFEAQKAYARQLLTHRNPYTKLTYAEDPAVALVEINNENGLIHTWLGGNFDTLPDVFMQDLQKQWNDWLARHHNDTAALSKAWGARNELLGAEMLVNPKMDGNLDGWNVEQHKGAAVDSSIEDGMAVLRVRKTGTAGWHVQFNQPKLMIRKDAVYTVSFRAAADCERKVALGLMQAHEPWGTLGFGTTLTMTKEPQSFTFTFIANADDNNARMNFGDMNQEGATFRFGRFSLKPGGRVGMGENESLEKRNFPVPKVADARTLTAGGREDWVRFLWETERKYWTGMRKFLREDLGVKVPIVGTIVATSTPNLMADMDIVDTHAYWEHPQFPGKPWDMNNWFVKNISMVDHPDEATVTALAFQRVAGKPHIVSEYNHPAPNTHASEGPLFIAAFGALQDWDAIFLYTYSHEDKNTKAGCISGFFDIGQHPTVMANVPVASLLFRRGDLNPASQLLQIPLPPEKEIEFIAQKGNAWGVLPVGKLGVDLKNAILHRIALDISGKSPVPAIEDLAKDLQISDTGEMKWRLPAKDKGVLELRGVKTKSVIGHVDNQRIDLGHGVQFMLDQTRTGWCTVSLALLEGESFERNPRRALLVATGIVENTGMVWKDETRCTVGTKWGKPPSIVETIGATIQIPRNVTLPTIYPLNDRGQRSQGFTATSAGDNIAQFKIGAPNGTLWYEIEWK